MTAFEINGRAVEVDVDDTTPLLWVVRDELGLPGTKFGCGAGLCGSCTVQLDGEAIRSCITPVSQAAGKSVRTIEGLASPTQGGQGAPLTRLQEAWIALQVPQCGYCQSGQLMSASALLVSNPAPSDDDIDEAMKGNICRCGMYGRIKAAIKLAASGEDIDAVPSNREALDA